MIMPQREFITWSEGSFVTTGPPAPTVPRLSAHSWWHTNSASPRAAVTLVTHLGTRQAAEFRGRTNAGWNAHPTHLFEVDIPDTFKLHDRILVEPPSLGPDPMDAFEAELLASTSDAALYWNQKEEDSGSWSVVVRRLALGELPNATLSGAHVINAERWQG